MNGARPRIGVMFDLDGTLVDTSYVHTLCWWEALRQYGHVVPMAVIHRAIGMGSDKLLDQVLDVGHAVETWKDPEDLLHHIHGSVLGHPLEKSLP